eukprot:2635580-Prymnesium_polylepis.1
MELVVTSAVDVGAPSGGRGGAIGKHTRLLRLQLTDGLASFVAIEYRPLHGQIVAGVRLRLAQARACEGLLLLEPETTEVLREPNGGGAEVDHSTVDSDAWEQPVALDPLDPPPLFSPVPTGAAAPAPSKAPQAAQQTSG